MSGPKSQDKRYLARPRDSKGDKASHLVKRSEGSGQVIKGHCTARPQTLAQGLVFAFTSIQTCSTPHQQGSVLNQGLSHLPGSESAARQGSDCPCTGPPSVTDFGHLHSMIALRSSGLPSQCSGLFPRASRQFTDTLLSNSSSTLKIRQCCAQIAWSCGAVRNVELESRARMGDPP